jgi:DeoR/GlpR family transcriptional regulator of sugar metabolism
MLNEERKGLILKSLQEFGRVSAAELSERLAVSEDTIRRDLRDLADQGLLRRVHGGALPPSPAKSPTHPSYSRRIEQSTREKGSIAIAASRLVKSGQTIIIDGGTTAVRLAEALATDLQLTVVTHSLPVALTLSRNPGVKLIFIGGSVDSDYLSTKGAVTVAGYRQIRADLCFISVASLHPTAGLCVLDLEDAEVKRAMMAGAHEVACLCSSEKLNTTAPFAIGPATMVNHLVTDTGASEEIIRQCIEQGLKVTRA